MAWREEATLGKVDVEQMLNQKKSMTTGPGVGITGGIGTICESAIQRHGNIINTQIIIDLTGLASSTTDLDIIGKAGGPAYIGSLLATESGAIWTAKMTCLEVPTGGVTDIDLYEATEATGVFDGGIAALAEKAIVTAGGAWTLGLTKAAVAVPTAGKYLYLTGGAAGTAAAYTEGRFLIEFTGYIA